MGHTDTARFEAGAERIAQEQQDIQARIDREERSFSPGEDEGQGAMQAGARRYPEPPFPEQHQRKPGLEWALDPAPMYDAPFYRGSGKLQHWGRFRHRPVGGCAVRT
jgi:hypothetical protein